MTGNDTQEMNCWAPLGSGPSKVPDIQGERTDLVSISMIPPVQRGEGHGFTDNHLNTGLQTGIRVVGGTPLSISWKLLTFIQNKRIPNGPTDPDLVSTESNSQIIREGPC